MKRVLGNVLALLAAVLAPSALIIAPYAVDLLLNAANEPAAWERFRSWLFLIMTSSFYVIVLGVPVYLLLRWRKALRWWSAVCAGFVLGGVPSAVSLWPGGNAGPGNMNSHSEAGKVVYTMVDGVTTREGWQQYAEVVGTMGLLGAVSGLAFWLVWRSMRSNKTMEPTR
jgi:hypothetical protein